MFYYTYDPVSKIINTNNIYEGGCLADIPQFSVCVPADLVENGPLENTSDDTDDEYLYVMWTEVNPNPIDDEGNYIPLPQFSQCAIRVKNMIGEIYYDSTGRHVVGDAIFHLPENATFDSPPNFLYNAWDGEKWISDESIINTLPVPDKITSRQAKLKLLDTNIQDADGSMVNLLDSLEATIGYYRTTYESDTTLDADTKKEIKRLLIEYDSGSDYERHNIFIVQMSTRFNLSSLMVDQLFREASKL